MAEFQFAQPNFYNMLSDLGGTIGNAVRQNRLRGSLADFSGDYTKAAEELMRMGHIDEATKLYTAGQLANYRDIQGQVALDKAQPSAEDQILRSWLEQNRQPSYLGPPESSPNLDVLGPQIDSAVAREEAEAAGMAPSGVPGVSVAQGLDAAPGLVQEKLATKQQQKAWEYRGKAQGEREGFADNLVQSAPQLSGIVDNLVAIAREADPETFENALGPWQGTMDAETLSGAFGLQIAQTAGGINNYLAHAAKEGFLDPESLAQGKLDFKHPKQLGGGFTSTLRAKVNATSASLINLMQRLLRVPGIGQQSDYELRQIIAQAGELNKSKTKEDYAERLRLIIGNLKAMGFPVDIPSVEQVTAPSTKMFSDRAQPGAPATDSVTPRKVQTFSVDPQTGTMTPSVQVPGAVKSPHGAYTGPAPAGTVMSNGTQTIIKGADGRWYDKATGKPLPAPRP